MPEEKSQSESSAPLSNEPEAASRRILIGSQRDPAAYRPRRRDWTPIEPETPEAPCETPAAAVPPPPEASLPEPSAPPPAAAGVPQAPVAPVADAPSPSAALPPAAQAAAAPAAPSGSASAAAAVSAHPQLAELQQQIKEQLREKKGPPVGKIPPPNLRDRLSPDLEAELEAALGGASVEDLLGAGATPTAAAPVTGPLPEARQSGRVISVRRDDVFVDLGGREQGIVSLRQFAAPPAPGDTIEVVVQRLNPDDGLYELALPNASAQVEDWSDIASGMVVDARVTGHNTGGLECEVNHLRGFIPMSQIALYRTDDASQFVGQTLKCVITEANPERRNLVLSRRAMLEREREETRAAMFETLQPGQTHDGLVRKIMDFGAFVDLGGVDGLLHVSQLAWHRVNHPSEVLQEGQAIKVKIEKIDPATRKISLSYRELLENPWTRAAEKFPPNAVVRGRVSKIMEFGAFVQVEPGVEGLVHVSELSHKRVWRVSDMVKEGDEVEVLVLSVDPAAQRMSLSMKALAAPPEKPKKDAADEAAASEAEAAPVAAKHAAPSKPLRGGLGRTAGGEQFGLKW